MWSTEQWLMEFGNVVVATSTQGIEESSKYAYEVVL